MPSTRLDDRSVAPLVGVVLLVGVVVVLSAVSAVVFLGIGQDPGGPNVRAAVDVDQSDGGMLTTEIRVTAIATDNVDEIVVKPDPDNRVCTTRKATITAAGETATIGGCAPGDTFLVLARDDGESILLQKYTVD